MITGHVGIAAAIRGGWRDVSFGWLLLASVAPDVVDVMLALAGVCTPPGLYSHSIPAAMLLGALLGAAAYVSTGSRATGVATAAAVLAHLPPDLVTGYKVYWPGGPLLGLRLYQRPALDFLAELPIVMGGWWLLRRAGAAPHWATGAAIICALVATQAAVDIAGPGLKPSACPSPAVARR